MNTKELKKKIVNLEKILANKARSIEHAVIREAKETHEAALILLHMSEGKKVSKDDIEFLKNQSIDVAKALAIIGLQAVPFSSVAIVAIEVVAKKHGFSIFPKLQSEKYMIQGIFRFPTELGALETKCSLRIEGGSLIYKNQPPTYIVYIQMIDPSQELIKEIQSTYDMQILQACSRCGYGMIKKDFQIEENGNIINFVGGLITEFKDNNLVIKADSKINENKNSI